MKQYACIDKPILGVSKSVSGRIWQDNLDLESHRQAAAISQRNGLPEIVGRILAGRNVPLEEVSEFMEPKVRNLMPDPLNLRDMDKASERIVEAVRGKEKIAIFGDYDVDGATSAALLKRLFTKLDVESMVYIPDRVTEGYGPNPEALRELRNWGANLLITVDCGSSSFEAFEEAKKLELDVIVIDHHQVGEEVPETVGFVNPNRQDDLSGVGYLAAVGITFMLVVELNRKLRESGFYKDSEPNLLEWLDLVALGTVCDLVPLRGLNRAFIRTGLINFHKRMNPGIRELCDVCKLNEPANTYHIGYLLGPRINAGGRIGKAGLGAELLWNDKSDVVRSIAEELDALNFKRQEMQRTAFNEADIQVQDQLKNNPDLPVLIVSSENWHQGLVGLVASRITESYRRPSVAVSFSEGDPGKGSGRSIDGIDLGSCVRAALEDGLLVAGGGHAMAVGLTICQKNIEKFRDCLTEKIGESVKSLISNRSLKIDSTLNASGATLELMEQLEHAGPYGSGHKEPIFALPAHKLKYAKIVGKGHISATISGQDGSQIKGIAFNALEKPLGQFLLHGRESRMHFAGKLSVNHWQGKRNVELKIIDAADPNEAVNCEVRTSS